MRTLKTLSSILLVLFGFCSGSYGGIGALFVLGDGNPKYRAGGFGLLCFAAFGAVLLVLGIVALSRTVKSGKPADP